MSELAQEIIQELELESESTVNQLKRIPKNKFGWRPHKKSMSLLELGAHIASSPRSIAELLNKDSLAIEEMNPPEFKPSSTEELVKEFIEGAEVVKKALKNLSDESALQNWHLTKSGEDVYSIPKIGLGRFWLLNHLYHHRGQLQVYLRLLDIPVPIIYGPTADENPF